VSGVLFGVSGPEHDRLAEGILCSLDLVGRHPDLHLAAETAAAYRSLDADALRRFFSGCDLPAGRESARAMHLLTVFRGAPGRNVTRVLELGRSLGLWGKVLPGMDEVTDDEAAWCRTVERVRTAYREACTHPGRLSREWVFGALLAELPDEDAARRALGHLALPDEPEALSCGSRAAILASYRQHRAEANQEIRRLPSFERPAPARASGS